MATKYYLRDDPERGYTPSQVKKMGMAKQLDIMETWFRHHYEDPAEETPYESKEGGYQFIWGGPYDADEELQDEFSRIVSLDRIQSLSKELASENWQWAPSSFHPSRSDEGRDADEERPYEPDLDEVMRHLEAGAEPRYGNEYERSLRKDITGRLDALEKAVRDLSSGPAGIGHNGPPSDEEAGSLTEQNQADVIVATEVIKAELTTPSPDAMKIGRAVQVLKGIGKWLAAKVDKAVDKGIELSVAAGILWASTHASTIGALLDVVVKTATNWLYTVTLPF